MPARHGKQAFRGGERRSWPAWVWLLLGALLGIVLSIAVLLRRKLPTLRSKNLPQPNPEATAPKEPEQALADDAARKQAAAAKSDFDFYSVLPEKEVVIPDAELSAKARAEQQRAQQQAAQAQANATNGAAAAATPAAAPTGGGHYMLQVTATNDPKAAEEFKARLALLGFSAKVYTSSVDGKTRVRLGPYASASETEAAKRALAQAQYPLVPGRRCAEKLGRSALAPLEPDQRRVLLVAVTLLHQFRQIVDRLVDDAVVGAGALHDLAHDRRSLCSSAA